MTAEAMAIARPDIGTTIRNYISLTKPMIIALLLITTVPAMVVAERGWPSSWLVLATLIGGSLSAGGANAINCWYDRDIDGVMRRTLDDGTLAQRRGSLGNFDRTLAVAAGAGLLAGIYPSIRLGSMEIAAALREE